MTDTSLASSGDIVFADTDRVYVADGFGSGRGDYKVTVFDADTGHLIWQRDDLTPVDTGDDVFLQAIADDALIVNGQFGSVTSVDSATGASNWSFSLPEGYGAVRSAVTDQILIVAAEAPTEGDVRPPLVYGLNLVDGSELWQTPLADGMDLQWNSPPASDALVFVSSNLSHPRSASGNMVHALDLATGAIRWTVDLGGDQGFHFFPALITGDSLVVRSPEGDTVALRTSDGTELWRLPKVNPLAVGADGNVYVTDDRMISVLDSTTGETTVLVTEEHLNLTPSGAVIQDVMLIVTGRGGVTSYDIQTGDPLWQWKTAWVVAPPAVTSNLVALPTDERAVIVIDIP